jgi:YD repeat-containing protein
VRRCRRRIRDEKSGINSAPFPGRHRHRVVAASIPAALRVKVRSVTEAFQTLEPHCGKLTSATDELSNTWTYQRNGDGTLDYIDDARGKRTSFDYFTTGDLKKITYPSPLGHVDFTYDGLSRLATMTDGRGDTLRFTWGKLDRLTLLENLTDSTSVSYDYNAADGLHQRTDGSGTTYGQVRRPEPDQRDGASGDHDDHVRVRRRGEHRGPVLAEVLPQAWRRETFKFSTDPELEARVRDVIGLYPNSPEKAIVLCVDVEALGRQAPRMTLYFTPNSGSWLNLVEVFFSIITWQAIRRRTFGSVSDLIGAIRRFIAGWNERCHAFMWTKSPDEVFSHTRQGRPNHLGPVPI